VSSFQKGSCKELETGNWTLETFLMLKHLKSLPLTIVLTILIWMYAEAEFTSTQEGVPVRIQIQAARPDQTSIRVVDEKGTPVRGVNVQLTLQGAKGQIDRIMQQSQPPLAGGGDSAPLPPLTLTLGENEDKTLSLLPRLNAMPYFREKNVRVLACSPDHVELDIDRLVRFSRPLEKLNRNGVPVTIDHFDPQSVDVVIPAKVLEKLGREADITVSAEPQQRLAGTVGVVHAVPVRIVPVFKGESIASRDDRITVTPQDAVCYLKVNAEFSEHYVLPRAIPILVTGTAEVLSPYRIDVTPKEVSVEVAGTPDAIAKLKAAMGLGSSAPLDETIRVYLDLSPEDRPTAAAVSRRLRYVLPEGISVESRVEKVEFRLSELGTGTRP
jgi:hypothetical protein